MLYRTSFQCSVLCSVIAGHDIVGYRRAYACYAAEGHVQNKTAFYDDNSMGRASNDCLVDYSRPQEDMKPVVVFFAFSPRQPMTLRQNAILARLGASSGGTGADGCAFFYQRLRPGLRNTQFFLDFFQ